MQALLSVGTQICLLPWGHTCTDQLPMFAPTERPVCPEQALWVLWGPNCALNGLLLSSFDSAGSVHCGDMDVPATLECEMSDGGTSWIHICLRADGSPWKLGSGAFGQVFKVRDPALRRASQVPEQDGLVLPGQRGGGLSNAVCKGLACAIIKLTMRLLCISHTQLVASAGRL